ncbi:uncharacterized protein A4U43_C04F16970 [Asparagus officinalis]|uniref:RING-type E3 ubiquitin transferase n=1 Tax=Asparagus officinalis TaxID=4686 RepID=A0A5P1F655_ASPOF|nr:uncharacterized protein A4U43_C04F16970 [Asparagus officinalis]
MLMQEDPVLLYPESEDEKPYVAIIKPFTLTPENNLLSQFSPCVGSTPRVTHGLFLIRANSSKRGYLRNGQDCSQGFCSIYCPQWCYVIFPPPPPFSFVDDDDEHCSQAAATILPPSSSPSSASSASAFPPRQLTTPSSPSTGRLPSPEATRRSAPLALVIPSPTVTRRGRSVPSAARRGTSLPSNGLDEALISKISVYRYRRGEGVVDGTDCSVCLGEFREEESLRLLPKCSHAFHLQCIDTWLRSHSNCPLCRANIVSVNPGPPQLPPPPPPPPLPPSSEGNNAGGERSEETILTIEDLGEETSSGSDDDGSKENSGGDHDVIEIRDDEEGGVQEPSRRGRVSVADILQLSMEEEFMVAKDEGVFVDSGSSSRGRGENSGKGCSRSRSLHSVMSPVRMKRSVSSGRFRFARQGKVRSSVLPV